MNNYSNKTSCIYTSPNGYSGIVCTRIDEQYNTCILLEIYNPAGKIKAIFVLNDIPLDNELQHFIDDFPMYIGLLKEGEKHE